MSISILIVDDDAVDRLAVRRALRHSSPDAILVETDTCEAAIERLATTAFDCVLVDYRLPDGDGLALLRYMRESGIRVPVIMLTGRGDELLAVEALKSGAADYLPKAYLSADRLEQLLASTVQSRRAEKADEAVRREARVRLDGLTPRERQIVDELIKGKPNKAIAAELGISCRTVESHRAHVMRKTQSRSIADLVQLVLRASPEG